jgi:hypothetical protein
MRGIFPFVLLAALALLGTIAPTAGLAHGWGELADTADQHLLEHALEVSDALAPFVTRPLDLPGEPLALSWWQDFRAALGADPDLEGRLELELRRWGFGDGADAIGAWSDAMERLVTAFDAASLTTADVEAIDGFLRAGATDLGNSELLRMSYLASLVPEDSRALEPLLARLGRLVTGSAL